MRSLIGGIFNQAPVAYTKSRGAFSRALSSGSRASQLHAYGSVGTLFSIVSLTSEATASVDWHLYRTAPSGLEEDRTEVTSHLALQLWNKPNPFFTRQSFVESVQQHIDLVGEGYIVIERNAVFKSIPLGLWFVRPDRMMPVTSATEYLTGWIYTSPDGEEVPLELQNVIQIKLPNPNDPYRGMGPVQSVLADIDSAKFSAEWNRNFFINGAQPGGFIKVAKQLSDTEFDEMMLRWRETHQGVSNAHRVGILENAEWVPNSFSPEQMQFAAMRDIPRDIIREAFRIHPHMLGQSEDVNLANAQAADYTFARWTEVPRLERWKSVLNNFYLPLFGTTGQGVEFDYDSPIKEDTSVVNAERDSKTKAAAVLTAAGWNPDDVLSMLNLPTMRFDGPRGKAPLDTTGAAA